MLEGAKELAQPDRALVVLVLVLAVVILGLLALWVAQSLAVATERRRRLDTARSGENRAAALLRAAGFEILEQQPTCVWPIAVDGITTNVESRADFLLRRGGLLFVADAKSGQRAPDPRLPATRRQLLEYLLVFEVDAVLLVDTERGVILTLDFPLLDQYERGRPPK